MTDTHIKINAVTPRVQYTGNGVTTVFPYEFPIFDDSDMVVYFGDEVQESGYTVSGAGQTEGGNVTFDTAPDDGVVITLYRNIPIERVTDFQEGGTFRPKNLNDEFDRQTAFLQQVQEALDRAVKVGVTSDVDPDAVLTEVERVYASIDNVDAVADNLPNINTVAGDKNNIDAVAGDLTNIDAVAGNETNIDAVAGDLTNIDTVATNISDIGTCATNMEDIQAAPGAATTASNAAIAAAASASSAAISAAGTHFKLFQHGWFDYQLNDMAWLRADTFSWQDGTVYSEAYNHLVDDVTNGTSQTETISGHTITYTLADDGHKIVSDANASEVEGLYNDTGVAWYYILDLVNHRFKLPRENPAREELVQIIRAKGTGKSIGLTDGTNNFSLGTSSSIGNSPRTNSKYDQDVGTASDSYTGSNDKTIGITTDSTKSGIVSDMSDSTSVYKGKQYLYFYVGQFTQTATEQTAGLNTELFNGKMDRDMSNMNPSATAKETIVGWGIPDYSAGVSISAGVTGSYTAITDGMFIFSADTQSVTGKVYVNNSIVSRQTSGGAFLTLEVQVIVSKNDTISWEGVFAGAEAIFYPLKGVQNA